MLALGKAKRGAGGFECRIDIVGEPAVVAEFKRGVMRLGEQAQKRIQPRQVFLHDRRQLEQHRPALVAEGGERAVEKRDRIGAFRLEMGEVRNPA